MRRVQLAAGLLGYSEVRVANLFALPSHATGEISVLGASPGGWESARAALAIQLDGAHGVLLAYGATEPVGPARSHFRGQVEWINEQGVALGIAAWRVGDGPRHPSRWQRWTSRAHPGLPFSEALAASLVRVPAPSVGLPTKVLG